MDQSFGPRRRGDRSPATAGVAGASRHRRRSSTRWRRPWPDPVRLNGSISAYRDQRSRYHLVGPRPVTGDLPSQLDLHPLTPAGLEAHILAGDDFVQWSLRFGLIVFDDGHLRRAATLIATSKPWPDANRKRAHAAKSVDLARRIVGSGDDDAAQEQVRTALSLAARARLLQAGVFPGSRDELPQQLADLGLPEVGNALASTIHDNAMRLADLAGAVELCDALVSTMYDAVSVA